jgi:predicted dehydrogenase
MNSTLARLGRRLRLAVIGGGPGSFIGPVHRAAARFDDHFEIVATQLSSNADKSRRSGIELGLPADRAYGTAEELFAGEAKRTDGADVVAIMTPNDSHHALSVMALARGLDIVCDKPLTTTLDDAIDLVKRVRASGVVFCQTFNYTGFPMVRQARAMVRDGDLGEIRMAHAQYIQGYHYVLTPGEDGNGPVQWRFNPVKAGISPVLGDIGCHAQHLVAFVTGLEFDRVFVDVGPTVPGRRADDTAGVLFRLANGAPGTLWITQAGAGAVHGLYFRIFGAKGGLEWHEEEPNRLYHARPGAPTLVYERGEPGLKPETLRAQRTEIGHPEGFQEAFAVLYGDVAGAVVARRLGEQLPQLGRDFPTVEDGARAMKFIAASVESSRTGSWADCRLKL